MFINNNVQKIAVENILNQIGEIYTKIGDEVILYPLKIVSGFTNFTESGEFKVNYNTENFTSDIGVVNSNEPIVCYWEGAYLSYIPETIIGSDYQIKHFSADEGRKIKTWIMQYSTELVEGEQLINDNSYTTIALNRNIRSFCTDWVPTDNEQRYYLYLYLDKKAKSPQFLKMISREPRYLPNGKLAGCELGFVNLNQSYSQSGKDVLNFVKMAHPGGNYAFPHEIETEEGKITILDINRLNNRGVRDIQLQFWNSYWLNSVSVYGAPKSNWKIECPRRLLLYNPHPAISSALDVSGSALNNYYAVFGAQTLYQSFWNNWKDKVQAYYDYGAEKTFLGGFKLKNGTWEDVMNTNPIANDVLTFNMWNQWTFKPKENETFEIPETPFTDTSITFSKDTNYTPQDFLNHNSFIFSAMEAMPMEFSETTRYTLGDFGALGRIIQGFVQTFTLGFNPGWTTNNTWVPNKNINFLIPTSTFNFGRLMTAEGQGAGSAPIPFDCVNPNFSGCGNKTCTCGYRFELTHFFSSPSQTIQGNGEGMGGNGIWDTKYLGQTQWRTGEWIFSNHEPVKWKSDCKAVGPIEKEQEYEVFLASYKGIGMTTCRMTFHNYINNDPANIESVWESIQMTNAKFKNDITLWTNTYKLNFSEEMNNEGVIEYPANVLPPTPKNLPKRINALEGEYLTNLKEGKGQIEYTGWERTKWGLQTMFLQQVLSLTPSISTGIDAFVSYRPNYDSPIKEVDLTHFIGLSSLSEYKTFTFRFISKQAEGTNTRFEKNIEVNIDNLPDNTWTQIKIAELDEVINGSNKCAYPNNKFRIEGDQTKTAGELLTSSNRYPLTTATPIYVWFNLDKANQKLKMRVDQRPIDHTEREVKRINFTEKGKVNKTFEIPKVDVIGNYVFANLKFWSKDGATEHKYFVNEIAIDKTAFQTGGKGHIVNFTDQLVSSATSLYKFNQDISISIETNETNTKINFSVSPLENSVETGFELYLYDNHYTERAIRNYKICSLYDKRVGKINNETENFFPGYILENFFINPKE